MFLWRLNAASLEQPCAELELHTYDCTALVHLLENLRVSARRQQIGANIGLVGIVAVFVLSMAALFLRPNALMVILPLQEHFVGTLIACLLLVSLMREVHLGMAAL